MQLTLEGDKPTCFLKVLDSAVLIEIHVYESILIIIYNTESKS